VSKLTRLAPVLSSLSPLVPYLAEDRDTRRRFESPWRAWYKTAEWQSLRWSCLRSASFTCAYCGHIEAQTSPDLAGGSPSVTLTLVDRERLLPARGACLLDEDDIERTSGGKITVTAGSTAVQGNGTAFQTDGYVAGDIITIYDAGAVAIQNNRIAAVNAENGAGALTMAANWAANGAAVAYDCHKGYLSSDLSAAHAKYVFAADADDLYSDDADSGNPMVG
jgi:hypothetical protein